MDVRSQQKHQRAFIIPCCPTYSTLTAKLSSKLLGACNIGSAAVEATFLCYVWLCCDTWEFRTGDCGVWFLSSPIMECRSSWNSTVACVSTVQCMSFFDRKKKFLHVEISGIPMLRGGEQVSVKRWHTSCGGIEGATGGEGTLGVTSNRLLTNHVLKVDKNWEMVTRVMACSTFASTWESL